MSWQPIALELLRGVCGAAPTMSTAELRRAGAPYDKELFKRGIDSLYFFACNPEHPRQRLYQVLWRAQLAEAKVVIEEIKRRGADVVVFKGLEVGTRHRPDQGFYASVDVDLLAAGPGLAAAEQVLYARGYVHRHYMYDGRGWVDLAADEVARLRKASFELVQFMREIRVDGVDADCLALASEFPRMFSVRDGAVYVAVCFDVHRNILYNFNVAPLWERAVPSALGVGRTFSSADHLWFLIHRYYFEIANGSLSELRVLSPIAAMLRDPELDWSRLVRNAVEANATAAFFYWLTFFHKLGAPAVTPELLDELRSHHAGSQRNWGWQLGRMLDLVEAFPTNLGV